MRKLRLRKAKRTCSRSYSYTAAEPNVLSVPPQVSTVYQSFGPWDILSWGCSSPCLRSTLGRAKWYGLRGTESQAQQEEILFWPTSILIKPVQPHMAPGQPRWGRMPSGLTGMFSTLKLGSLGCPYILFFLSC